MRDFIFVILLLGVIIFFGVGLHVAELQIVKEKSRMNLSYENKKPYLIHNMSEKDPIIDHPTNSIAFKQIFSKGIANPGLPWFMQDD